MIITITPKLYLNDGPECVFDPHLSALSRTPTTWDRVIRRVPTPTQSSPTTTTLIRTPTPTPTPTATMPGTTACSRTSPARAS